jgi:hypothetical protein
MFFAFGFLVQMNTAITLKSIAPTLNLSLSAVVAPPSSSISTSLQPTTTTTFMQWFAATAGGSGGTDEASTDAGNVDTTNTITTLSSSSSSTTNADGDGDDDTFGVSGDPRQQITLTFAQKLARVVVADAFAGDDDLRPSIWLRRPTKVYIPRRF